VQFNEFVQIMQKLEGEIDRTHNDQDANESYGKRNDYDNTNKSHNTDLQKDFSDPKSGKHFTAGEFEQDEPQPPKYQVVDNSDSDHHKHETDEGYIPEDKADQYQTSDNPIPESDSVAENNEGDEEVQGNEKDFKNRSKSVPGSQSTSTSFKMPKPASDKERRLYGAMLPKQGVYFLPQLKVVDFIRVLHNYKRQCIKEGKLAEVKNTKKKINELRNKEMLHQLTNM
jgi:hypothetical protein